MRQAWPHVGAPGELQAHVWVAEPFEAEQPVAVEVLRAVLEPYGAELSEAVAPCAAGLQAVAERLLVVVASGVAPPHGAALEPRALPPESLAHHGAWFEPSAPIVGPAD